MEYNIKQAIHHIMKEEKFKCPYLANALGINRTTLWARIDPNRKSELGFDKVQMLLDAMDYKIVIVPKSICAEDFIEIVSTTDGQTDEK